MKQLIPLFFVGFILADFHYFQSLILQVYESVFYAIYQQQPDEVGYRFLIILLAIVFLLNIGKEK